MKLCTFRDENGGARAGIAIDGRVWDVEAAIGGGADLPSADYGSVLGILRGGRAAFDAVRRLEDRVRGLSPEHPAFAASRSVNDVALLAPVPRPNTIRDFVVFEEHLVNAMHSYIGWKLPAAAWLSRACHRVLGRPLFGPPRVWYELPVYYKGSPDTVIGPEEPIVWPSYTRKLDYELELGVYLLEPGKDIAEAEARHYIAGYTIFNDVSARDIQLREMGGRMGPTKGKDFDSGNVMGPWLVTPDELGDPYALEMRASVNGEQWSSGTSSGMQFSFEQMIAYVSRAETLRPGDFFGSGTVGNGCGLELDRWFEVGDRITLEIDGLGSLSNPVVDGAGTRAPEP